MRHHEEPLLYEALAADLVQMMEKGVLRAGERLPSVRQFAAERGVSVATVLSAYLRLENRGLVEVRPKSGHYVRRQAVNLEVPRAPRTAAAPTRVSISAEVLNLVNSMRDPSVVPLGGASISPDLLPTATLNGILSSLAREMRSMGARYEHPRGARTLRQQLARRSLHWGLSLGEDDFIITNGAMEGLHLCLAALTRPGDTVAVESPAYFGLLQLIEQRGLKAVEIPKHPGTGLDLDALENILRSQRLGAVLCTPTYCNPMGTCMTDESRARLVSLLEAHAVPLIEDDVYGDLGWDGRRPPPAKAWDRTGNVVLVGSMSKTVAPGYRIGWVVPGKLHADVEALKLAHSIASPAPTQLAMAEFLSGGGYDRHLRRLGSAIQQQVKAYRDAVGALFPAGTRVTDPEGGFVLWLEMPAGVNAVQLQKDSLKQAIAVAPGPVFSARNRFNNFIRINCGYPLDGRMQQALETVAHLAHAQLGRHTGQR